MHGLTTIAALPRTGGAGMALRSETNTRPTHHWVIVPIPGFGTAYELISIEIGTGSERQRAAMDLVLMRALRP